MYVLKGFMTHAGLTNNTAGMVAPFGELSTQSLTYAREKGLYKSAYSEDLELTTFISAMDATPVGLTVDLVDHCVEISKYVFDLSQSTPDEIFADELLQDLLTTFSTVAENFQCGEIITDGTNWMPTWISWKNKSLPSLGVDNNIKIWFADQAFITQYDEYEIIVVPPTDNIDDFFKTGSEVETMLKSFSMSEIMTRLQGAKDNHPESIIRAEEYDYVDPYNANHKVTSVWNLLIYGAAGNNIDAINDTIIDFILSRSTHTRDEWAQILPDLFRRTEFVILPLWDQYAIPNRELVAGIYSPVTNLKRVLALVKQVVASYPASHIDDHVSLLSHPYKSLAMAAVGSVDNRNDWFKITDVLSDYIAVSSMSLDFSRMSQNTQDWAELLAEMLIQAEAMGKYTSVPLGMTKVTRDGILYLVSRHDNINYLVAAKANFPLIA